MKASLSNICNRRHTWSDAVDDSNESISIPPTGTKVVDLDSELSGHLGLDPLEQRLLGTDLPLLLGLPGGAALPHGPVLISPRGVAPPLHTRTGETLPELLQDPGVLLDLEIFLSTLFFLQVGGKNISV